MYIQENEAVKTINHKGLTISLLVAQRGTPRASS